MKKLLLSLIVLTILSSLFTGCDTKDDEQTPPELPPYESMLMDFEFFQNDQSAELLDISNEKNTNTIVNWAFSAANVFVWNVLIGTTLVVPVASFYAAISNEAVFIGDATWQWVYEFQVFTATYTARLTGQIRSSDVKWEMYISREGIGAFDEFMWYEGTSALDGNSGQWILYHSPEVPVQTLQIDWERTGEQVGDITYTYVRESSNGDPRQLSVNSYISYGLTEADLNAFYNIHYTTRDVEINGFLDVAIQWSTTEYNGRVMAEHFYGDTDWHCWDSGGNDAVCE